MRAKIVCVLVFALAVPGAMLRANGGDGQACKTDADCGGYPMFCEGGECKEGALMGLAGGCTKDSDCGPYPMFCEGGQCYEGAAAPAVSCDGAVPALPFV